ncbi:MAG: hypothetical protein R3230_01120 [Nitrosopumilaceae archaeon]|nr:hypothetical protein [Nitrosopumilaceae archaeon]
MLSYIGGAGFNWVIIIAPIVICIIDYKYLYRERVDGYEIPDIPMTNSNKFLKKLDKTHKNQKRNYD